MVVRIRKHNLKESYKEGLVAIWWYTKDGEFWNFSKTLNDAENDYGYLQYSTTKNHLNLWKTAVDKYIKDVKERAEIYNKGYKSVERGRVVYNIRTQCYEVICSETLVNDITFRNIYAGKFGIGRLRPDGSRHNSFPSGHTAMAFSSATILHREYGHLSPWVSVAGYSVATVTGISRMLNNRHWLTDVLVGASVGILGTELGYLITDRLLGNRGLVRPEDDEWSPVSVGRNPSYVGVAMGYNLLPYNNGHYERVAPSGVGFNIEGAWFFTPNVGVGAQAKVGRYADLVQRGMLGGGTIEEPQPLNSLALQGGLFYSLALDRGERWSAGAKALVGVSKNHYQRNEVVDPEGCIVGHLEHSTTEHLTATVGASVRYIAADNLGVRLFVDYNWMRTGSTFTPSEGATSASANPISFATYHTPLTIGLAFDAMLW